MAPESLKRKRDLSAEPKPDTAKRAYTRMPVRRAKELVPELFGPVAPDTFRRWHDRGAPNAFGMPPVELPPFALSSLANLTHAIAAKPSTAVCCASSTSNSSPADDGRGSFYTACSYHGSSRRRAPATGRVRLTLPENANSCSCASSTCAIASESRRIAYGTWTGQLCAWLGGPRGPNQPMSSPHAPSSQTRLLPT